jgi:hypothetical protein
MSGGPAGEGDGAACVAQGRRNEGGGAGFQPGESLKKRGGWLAGPGESP